MYTELYIEIEGFCKEQRCKRGFGREVAKKRPGILVCYRRVIFEKKGSFWGQGDYSAPDFRFYGGRAQGKRFKNKLLAGFPVWRFIPIVD
jgi:hypothetical protein